MSNVVHSAVVSVPDDGTSPVGSDEWNAGHNASLPDGAVVDQAERLILSGTERLTGAGAARVRVANLAAPFTGRYAVGSLTVPNDGFLLQYKRASLLGNARAILLGTAELFLFDLAPVGRLVLAGRGG